MKKEFESLPYRKNVSIIVFRDKEFLLVNKHEGPRDWWKFPQGGLDEEESLEDGAKREFVEEIGTDKIEIIGISKLVNKYDWDNKDLVNRKKARGQEQYFVVAKFVGGDSDLKPDNEEIRKVKWFALKDIINFSKKNKKLFDMYNGLIPKILKEFNLK